MQFGILSGTQKELGFERNSNETAENIWLLGCSFRGLRRDGFFFFPFRVLVMRIGGIDFVRSGEGFSLRGCPEFWFVTRDGLSAARWMGYYLEVPGVDGLLRVRKRCYGGCMLTNVPVYGNVVFLPEDGSCDGRGRIFRRVSEAGEDGILIEDLWERWFLLTPDGRRREVIRGLGPDPSPMGSGTGLQPARLSFGSPSVH